MIAIHNGRQVVMVSMQRELGKLWVWGCKIFRYLFKEGNNSEYLETPIKTMLKWLFEVAIKAHAVWNLAKSYAVVKNMKNMENILWTYACAKASSVWEEVIILSLCFKIWVAKQKIAFISKNWVKSLMKERNIFYGNGI